MSEREKALAGELYDACDGELIRARLGCQTRCQEYNKMLPSQAEERRAAIQDIVGDCTESFVVEQPFICDYGYNISFGDKFFSNYNCVILDAAKVTFGDNCMIAPNCSFYTAGHPLDAETRNSGLEYAYPITVGNNVWIGGNVTVLPGVTIGDNAVIGGGSVVTHDIPAGVVAVGNPCKVLKKIG